METDPKKLAERERAEWEAMEREGWEAVGPSSCAGCGCDLPPGWDWWTCSDECERVVTDRAIREYARGYDEWRKDTNEGG